MTLSLGLFLLSSAARADDTGTADKTIVEVHADAPVNVEARPTPSEPWRIVCGNACDTPLPTSAFYRVTGQGIRTSNVFTLKPNGDRALVKVDTRPKGAFTAGVVLTTIGSIFLTTATAVWIINAASPPPVGGGVDVVTLLIGSASLILGLPTLVTGAILMAHNGASRVAQD